MAIDNKYGNVDIPGVPDDEPVFILRGQDKNTPQAINQYADLSIINGATSEHAASARRRATEIYDWQDQFPDKVKVPD